MKIKAAPIVAESVAIVASILLAFGIQAWWDTRQESEERANITAALSADFRTTHDRLSAAIVTADILIDRTSAFMTLSADPASVTRDSLQVLVGAVFGGADFTPSLANYEGFLSSGKLALIEDFDLTAALADFHRALARWDELARTRADVYYMGAIWELRRSVGTITVLAPGFGSTPSRFEMGERAFNRFVSEPEVYAAVEAVRAIHFNQRRTLQQMEDASSRVLELLASE